MLEQKEGEGRMEQKAKEAGRTESWHKEVSSREAQEVYARPAYPDINSRAGYKVYQETECGIENCCFECVKRFICKEFEGGCDKYTRETYKNCSKIII